MSINKPYNIDPIDVQLANLYAEGQITLRQAAETFCECGWDNFINYDATYRRIHNHVNSIQQMKLAVISRVDWDAYTSALEASMIECRKLEKAWSDSDERNPHTTYLSYLYKLHSWLVNRKYQLIAEYEAENYGTDAFMDCTIAPSDYIQIIDHVRYFFVMLVEQFGMFAFHPDDVFAPCDFFQVSETGSTYISEDDARWLNAVMCRCHDICQAKGVDIYQLALDAIQPKVRNH